jgi:hypothetical protein
MVRSTSKIISLELSDIYGLLLAGFVHWYTHPPEG